MDFTFTSTEETTAGRVAQQEVDLIAVATAAPLAEEALAEGEYYAVELR